MSLFYTKPEGNDDFQSEFTGKFKQYRMSGGDIVLDSYWGQGVEVYYAPTCETHKWSWKNKQKAWEWANMRKQHLGYAKSGGKYSLPYTKITRL